MKKKNGRLVLVSALAFLFSYFAAYVSILIKDSESSNRTLMILADGLNQISLVSITSSSQTDRLRLFRVHYGYVSISRRPTYKSDLKTVMHYEWVVLERLVGKNIIAIANDNDCLVDIIYQGEKILKREEDLQSDGCLFRRMDRLLARVRKERDLKNKAGNLNNQLEQEKQPKIIEPRKDNEPLMI